SAQQGVVSSLSSEIKIISGNLRNKSCACYRKIKSIIWIICLTFFSIQTIQVLDQYFGHSVAYEIIMRHDQGETMPSLTVCVKINGKFTSEIHSIQNSNDIPFF